MIRIKRNAVNFAVDSAALLCMVGLLTTGLLVRYVLPPGTGGRGRAGLELWGLGRHDWGEIHFWISVTLVSLLLLHVALHWRWALTTAVRGARPTAERAFRSRQRTLWVTGVAFAIALAAITGGFLLIAGRHTQSTEPTGQRRGRNAASVTAVTLPVATLDQGGARNVRSDGKYVSEGGRSEDLDGSGWQKRRRFGKRCNEAYAIHDELER